MDQGWDRNKLRESEEILELTTHLGRIEKKIIMIQVLLMTDKRRGDAFKLAAFAVVALAITIAVFASVPSRIVAMLVLAGVLLGVVLILHFLKIV